MFSPRSKKEDSLQPGDIFAMYLEKVSDNLSTREKINEAVRESGIAKNPDHNSHLNIDARRRKDKADQIQYGEAATLSILENNGAFDLNGNASPTYTIDYRDQARTNHFRAQFANDSMSLREKIVFDGVLFDAGQTLNERLIVASATQPAKAADINKNRTQALQTINYAKEMFINEIKPYLHLANGTSYRITEALSQKLAAMQSNPDYKKLATIYVHSAMKRDETIAQLLREIKKLRATTEHQALEDDKKRLAKLKKEMPWRDPYMTAELIQHRESIQAVRIDKMTRQLQARENKLHNPDKIETLAQAQDWLEKHPQVASTSLKKLARSAAVFDMTCKQITNENYSPRERLTTVLVSLRQEKNKAEQIGYRLTSWIRSNPISDLWKELAKTNVLQESSQTNRITPKR